MRVALAQLNPTVGDIAANEAKAREAIERARSAGAQLLLFPELYVSTLAPPALRLAPTVSTARFVDEARAFKATLEAHIADDDRSRRNDD